MTELHEAPLLHRVGQGVALALAATAVSFVADPSRRAGLTLAQFALLLMVVALAGAGAGAGYYATDRLRVAGGWRKTVANVLTLLGFCALAFAVLVALR